jgi:hypothetical protein
MAAPQAAGTQAGSQTQHTQNQSRYTFRRATSEQSKARVVLDGIGGSGKTKTALYIATALVRKERGERIAVVDTQYRQSAKYAADFDFDIEELRYFAPSVLVEVLSEAARARYAAVVIDSWSPFWSGKGGMLEQVDRASRGQFSGWKEVRPLEREMMDAMLSYPGHIICTVRSKTEWVLEKNEAGKTEPRKVGMKPEQREGIEYEFDLVGSMQDATITVTKTSCDTLHGAVVHKPGLEFGYTIREWLEAGVDPVATDAYRERALAEDVTFDQLGELMKEVRRLGIVHRPTTDANFKPMTLETLIQNRGREVRAQAQGQQTGTTARAAHAAGDRPQAAGVSA